MTYACLSEADLLTSFLQANAATAKPKGLADSKYANADGEDAEGEDDDDHSSAALASVREPLLIAS